jgi:hypothetical protein
VVPGARALATRAARERLARAAAERAGDVAALALAPARLATSPRRIRGLPGVAGRCARTLPEADVLAADLDASIDELLAAEA